jgi:hypothetical protein
MIWYNEELNCTDQPEEITLTLLGMYTSPENLDMGQSAIVLRLSIERNPNDTIIIKTMMEKNPASLGSYAEPSTDEVKAKYYRQVLRVREKIQRTSFKDILDW